jgi:hypothetical protein
MMLIENNSVVAIVPFAEVIGFVAVAVSVSLFLLEEQSVCSRTGPNFVVDVWKHFSA